LRKVRALGLPDVVVLKLFDACNKALADPRVRSRLARLGYDPAPLVSLAQFRAMAMQA
jgi:hypothetical protein